MSTLAGKAYHPVNGSTEDIWEGFSWPCFFFGFAWLLYKQMWAAAAVAIAILVGLVWLVHPLLAIILWGTGGFFANGLHAKSLLQRGYLTELQWQERQQNGSKAGQQIPPAQTSPSVADELSKLAALKAQGILTEGEFLKQKSKLLS
jgi:hypothetical protein